MAVMGASSKGQLAPDPHLGAPDIFGCWISFLLTARSFLLLVFVAYGTLAWSFLLMVEIWFGPFCLQWKVGLVYFAYGAPVRKLGLVLFAYGFPTVSKNDEL